MDCSLRPSRLRITAAMVRNWKNRKNNGINQYIILYWVNLVLDYILLLNILLTFQRERANTWFIQQLHTNSKHPIILMADGRCDSTVPARSCHFRLSTFWASLQQVEPFLSRLASLLHLLVMFSHLQRFLSIYSLIGCFFYFLIRLAESAILTPAHWANQWRKLV